jgi:histidyl-tRNA synthetase
VSGTARPKGTQDFLPAAVEARRRVENAFRDLCSRYGYREIATPTFEHAEVFVKSSGSTSDIVTKEMYAFRDRAGRDLVLRPEGTPGVVRAVLEAGLRLPVRLFYVGPFFRYSQPQKGRFREFHQVGVEALGESSPLTDAEVIALGRQFYQHVGITDCTTFVNSIGCAVCRPPYREKLIAFLTGRADSLCGECRQRTHVNPLRVFDCKNPACQTALADAPAPRASLCPGCAAHLSAVLRDLDRRDLRYVVNDRLVRGLDYYNRTTFEYVSESIGAQDSLGGGGRYDYLIRDFGGPDAPAVGFALGVERTLLAAPAVPGETRRPLVFLVWLSPAELPLVLQLADELRSAGIAARIDFDSVRVKGQFRAADAAGARCCVIVGPDEVAKGVYSVKDLATAVQSEVPAGELAGRLRALLT